MKQISFTSFKGGAGKTTALMAATSALSEMGKSIAIIDTDENQPISEWRDKAIKEGAWDDTISVYEADDMSSFEAAFEDASGRDVDITLIDTRGGGSELNNACIVNTHLVIIPSALTTLDINQALSTFEHVIGIHQSLDMEIPTALLVQRMPVGKLTISQRSDLEALSQLPSCETQLHNRDAYAALGNRGLLHLAHAKIADNPMKRISVNHIATAMKEARSFAVDLLEGFHVT